MKNNKIGMTKTEKFLSFLREFRKALYAVIFLAGLLIIGVFDINLPVFNPFVGERRNLFIAFMVGVVIFYIPSKWFINRFYTVDSDFVFEIDASPEDDVYISVYEIGKEKMDEMEIKGSSPTSWRTVGGKQAYMAREVNLEDGYLKTTHHAEMSDIEMMEYRNKVDEGRLRSKKWALVGMKLYARFDTIVENIEARFWTKQTDKFMEETHNAKEDVKAEVESEIPELSELNSDDKEETSNLQSIIDNADVGIESVNLSPSGVTKTSEKQESTSTDG